MAGTRGEGVEAADFFAEAGLAAAAFFETGLAEAKGFAGGLINETLGEVAGGVYTPVAQKRPVGALGVEGVEVELCD